MALTDRQRAVRLVRIRKIVARMFPPPAEAPSADAEAEAEPEAVLLDAPLMVDMSTLPPTAVDASLPW
jgi:hypothetical protein